MTPEAIQHIAHELRLAVGKVVIGQERAVDLLLVALISQGHILLEGVPGVGKTLLAKTFASLLHLDFGRIQFTPDLMPGDLLGANLFDFQKSTFSLVKGPIFTELLLADEINRTPPKTQSALLEAMQERFVTLDGTRHTLGESFMVVATQNPIEHEGTYPLPEAQLDRFLFRIFVGYPNRDQERALVGLHGNHTHHTQLQPMLSNEHVAQMRHAVANIKVADSLIDYIVDLVRETRNDSNIMTGASPRAAKMLATSSRALAAIQGRDYVIPDDIKQLFIPGIEHRITLSPGADIEGTTARQVLNRIIDRVAVPR